MSQLVPVSLPPHKAGMPCHCHLLVADTAARSAGQVPGLSQPGQTRQTVMLIRAMNRSDSAGMDRSSTCCLGSSQMLSSAQKAWSIARVFWCDLPINRPTEGMGYKCAVSTLWYRKTQCRW